MSLNPPSTADSTQPPTGDTPLPRGFHWLQVQAVERETADASSVLFHCPGELTEAYTFKQGQYLTLLREIGGEVLRRPYSLCTSPADHELRICAKQILGGRMSTFINSELKAGDWLAVMEPNGRFFTELDMAARRHYVGIAGGSGITPVMSLLKTTLAHEPNSTFTLFYGNRTTADIIFRESLSDLKNRFLGRLQIVHVLADEQTDVELFHGMLDTSRVEALIAGLTNPEDIDCFFICGPGPMMDGARDALVRLDVDTDRIKIESFGSAPAIHSGAVLQSAGSDADSRNVSAKVRIGGNTIEINIPPGCSVLDAALAAKLDLPYACKGGVCCTCKARLVEGSVDMAVNYGLEPDEIKRGYVLTCQAVPTSDHLVVDYDG